MQTMILRCYLPESAKDLFALVFFIFLEAKKHLLHLQYTQDPNSTTPHSSIKN